MTNEICVFAPATVSNVACGFDVMGFALEEPGDRVTARLVEEPGVRIVSIVGDEERLPRDPDLNTAGVAVQALLRSCGKEEGVGIELAIEKQMPLGSGLGSSAASAVAAVVACNILLGEPCSLRELLPFAMEAERVACGSAHADNVAPALLGGFVIIRSYDPLDVIAVETPEDLVCTVLRPHIEIKTRESRALLPEKVLLQKTIEQTGNAAGLVVGLLTGDYELIGRSLQDVIVEPIRQQLIPGFSAMKSAALGAGALGCSISGSGPSLFALSQSHETAQRVAQAMSEACPCPHDCYQSKVNRQGPGLL